ncbi:hypothetical protein S40288_03775 [Stachybotrys chartarum IBT 40288]|nr:hypothetical protein S40288_03775 [Stachybotrys chartarum IBT 40288]
MDSPASSPDAIDRDPSEGISSEPGEQNAAPKYAIPLRDLAAVEIPAIVESVDRAVKAFGRNTSLRHAYPTRNSIPLYLNPESPYCKPIMSHNAQSHNVVLKVTVPRRTGRKRKRGSDGPWLGDLEVADVDADSVPSTTVCSVARKDDPKLLRQKLEENVGKYHVEAVGTTRHTHRFRGLADFYWDMSKSDFTTRYVEQVLPGDVETLRKFSFAPGFDVGPNVDVIPPPMFTHMRLPFNYAYSQNPYVRATADGDTINTTAVKHVGYFIGAEAPAPAGPQIQPDLADPHIVEIMAELEMAFQERPIWTRRSLLNHLGGKLRNWNELKKHLNYAAYQFKGGPWRDAVVQYGIDPRTDPKYRQYQTLMFKLPRQVKAHKDQTWHSLRRMQTGPVKEFLNELSESHVFDGETYHTDGKVWQVCDITDSLLKDLLEKAAIRPTWDVTSGWYHGGLWAKVKAIMKTKFIAIRFGRRLTPHDFSVTLETGDMTPTRTVSSFHMPLPNLHLTDEELRELRGKELPKKKASNGYSVRVRDRNRPAGQAAETPTVTETPDIDEVMDALESDEGDSGSGGENDSDDDAAEPEDVASVAFDQDANGSGSD